MSRFNPIYSTSYIYTEFKLAVEFNNLLGGIILERFFDLEKILKEMAK
jgi:hypothetical protein